MGLSRLGGVKGRDTQNVQGGYNPTFLTLRGGTIFQAKGGVQSRTTKAKGGSSPLSPPPPFGHVWNVLASGFLESLAYDQGSFNLLSSRDLSQFHSGRAMACRETRTAHDHLMVLVAWNGNFPSVLPWLLLSFPNMMKIDVNLNNIKDIKVSESASLTSYFF